MKFAAGLVLATIAVTTVHAGNPSMQKEVPSESSSTSVDSSKSGGLGTSCNFACLAVMSPVTDENGVTYSNECMMRAAKCKDTGPKENVLDEYKRLYGRSFGASRNDDAGDESASDESGSYDDESASDESGSPTENPKMVKGTKSVDSSDNGDNSASDSSADGTPTSYCPNVACLDVYDPVSDENGVTYPNKCSMEVAKCKGPRENVLDEYKRLYGKSFGASRGDDAGDESASDESGSSSENPKMVNGTKGPGKAEKSKKSTKTSSHSASGIGSLYEDGSEGIIDDGSSTVISECASACPAVSLPVCGSDGVWYSNPCRLKIAACKQPKKNIVESGVAACSSKMTKKAGQIGIMPVGL
ncbi:hypothetical protein PHYPSEUDO_011925 [Phytophthora pseudosyringae]|uniref:Kazal-like domain-containing protein n=1 Tax=Phytophthora pseudosyringae TaxID=221518 RepID=A0A8T1W474_9STRA|nr:hypothetical protein PHYPSEUDO_011925 [Phytophthora pseudosyringae]